jgi:butyryl-CoA dehydrogenase
MQKALVEALTVLETTTACLLKAMQGTDIDLAMANSVRYLEMFGHVVIGWMWLRQGMAAARALDASAPDMDFYRGKLQAMAYFARWELPHVGIWGQLLQSLDDTPHAMRNSWF